MASPRDKHVANTLLRQRQRLGVLLPFYCECDDETCSEVVWMTAAAYDAARRVPLWRPLADAHRRQSAA